MKNKQKAFVILTPGFAASEKDTNCLPMQQKLVQMITKIYPQIQVIILSFQYPYHVNEYQWFNTTVFSFNGQNKGGIPKLILRKKVYSVLKRIHQEKEIVGLLSFWLNECALVGKKFADEHSVPHYCWLLGQDAKKENHYPQKLAVKGNELIALSDFLQEEFEKNHRVKPFAVIPPGIQINQLNNPKRDIDLFAAGSLIPLKQFEIFIELVAEIRNRLPNVKAVLSGDGPERKHLQMLIEKAGIKENIQLTGELPHNDVLGLMQRTKVLVHPSSYEGFAGVFLEALGAGAHVVSFCRAMRKEIEHWHIVKSKTEMKQKVLELLQNQDLQYKNLTGFPIETTAQKIMSLYV